MASSAFRILIFAWIYRLRPEWSTILLIARAASWLVGNALWIAGQSIVAVVPWWAGFLVLTITSERLELAQVVVSRGKRALLVLAAAILLVGLGLSTVQYASGIQLAGVGLLALTLWLLAFDVARRRLNRRGSPRFASVALLLGYAWLGLAAIVWLLGPERVGGFWYAAMLHTIFLGFAFSMIFGHAPTMVPAITGLQLPFVRISTCIWCCRTLPFYCA